MGIIDGSTTVLHRAKHQSVAWKYQFRMQRTMREFMFTLWFFYFLNFYFYSEGTVLECYQESAIAANSVVYSAKFGENLKPAV